jgi:hypothetical protein
MEQKYEPGNGMESLQVGLDDHDPWRRTGPSLHGLRGLSMDWDNRQNMRSLLAKKGGHLDVGRLRADQVILQVNALIGSGSMRLGEIQLPPAPAGPGFEIVEAESEAAPPSDRVADDLTTWIAIKLLDMAGDPIPSEKYRVELKDGTTREGKLDQNGVTRVSNLQAGVAQVCFPDLDESAWEAA